MATTKKKETKKKVTAKKSTAKAIKPAAKKVAVKKVVKTVKPAAKKVAVKKTVKAVKPAVKKPVAKKVATLKKERKPRAIQVAATKAIEPVKKMAVMIPPSPHREIVPKTEPTKSIVPVKEEPKAIAPVKEKMEEKPQGKDKSYNPQAMEKKWQQKWEADKLYRSVIDRSKKKHYALTMLPYPSGDLHIGHWYAMTPSDARARYMRMKGYNVLFPMGFDAFGLPAENAAIRDGVHPMTRTFQNIERMRKQMRSMGAMFDWEREAVSASPEYYKWTEWFFIQLYKQGLAYRKMSAVDWCPKCNTTLAREQVWGDDRHCERCNTPVIKKNLNQWFFKATQYADELLNFDDMDWPQTVKTLQTNWIDRSEGAEVKFSVDSNPPSGTSQLSVDESSVTIFTTRPDTLWGATFMVFSPEHPLVDTITTDEYKSAVEEYKAQAARQSEIQRGAVDKEKTGVFTGAYAINPVNQKRIPIWIADYVMMSYGTGAIMAVPAHDERDFAFAKKYDLPIIEVIRPEGQSEEGALESAYVGAGVMVNSDQFDGTKVNTEKGRKNPSIAAVIDWLQGQGVGKE
ncbi:MAG: class I tRNA ligase family protein, partial [Anaerolineales bacterium]|nr:class I tRNA ligase family protein [Anaerolineales bacterium]